MNHHFSSIQDYTAQVSLSNISHFIIGLRQALFWRRRITPSASNNTVIFSLLSPQGLLLPNVLEITRALKNVCDMNNVTEIYKSPNSHYIGFSFNNIADSLKVRSHFLYFNNSIVFHVLPKSNSLHFKLTWLPPLFSDNRLHHFLSKYASSHSFQHEHIKIVDDIYTPTNTIIGTMELLPHVQLQHLPHLIPLPPPHLGSAFLIISGRPPLCLKCREEGHVRKNCTSSKCSSCLCFHLNTSPCPSPDHSFPADHLLSWTAENQVELSHDHPDINTDSSSITFKHLSSSPPSDFAQQSSTRFSSALTTDHTVTQVPSQLNRQCTSSFPTASTSSNMSPTSPLHSSIQPFTSPVISNTPSFHTKRFTKSMSSINCSNHRSLNSAKIFSTIALSSGLFHYLTDEAASSDDDTLDIQMDNLSHQSPCESIISLSDNERQSYSQYPPSSAALLPPSDDESSSASLTPSSKKVKLSTSNPSLQILSQDNTSPTVYASDWADQVEVETSLNLKASPTSGYTSPIQPDSTKTALPDSTSDPFMSTLLSYVLSDVTQSYCLIHCYKCSKSTNQLWPLRRLYICPTCHEQISILYERRYYPLPDKALISLAISPQDPYILSFQNYMAEIFRAKVELHPLSFSNASSTSNNPS